MDRIDPEVWAGSQTMDILRGRLLSQDVKYWPGTAVT